MGQGRPRQALRWLAEARALDSATPDPVAAAELLAGETRCWVALDEPREAIGPARAAWERWLALANGPSSEVILPAARALLAVLSSPDPPPKLSDDEVFAAWLEDRLVIEFQRSAGLVLGLLADVHRVDLADEVANDYLGWIERFTPKAGQGLLRARFALRLGDVYDRCDDSARALAVLQDGLQRLDGYADQPEISNLRGQLTFNAGNQHAKLGQLEDALEAFTSAAEIGVGGRVEAALRDSLRRRVHEVPTGAGGRPDRGVGRPRLPVRAGAGRVDRRRIGSRRPTRPRRRLPALAEAGDGAVGHGRRPRRCPLPASRVRAQGGGRQVL